LDTLPDSANYVREISRDPKTMGDEEVQIRVQPYSEIDTRANTDSSVRLHHTYSTLHETSHH